MGVRTIHETERGLLDVYEIAIQRTEVRAVGY
jgi:hypothetical protein